MVNQGRKVSGLLELVKNGTISLRVSFLRVFRLFYFLFIHKKFGSKEKKKRSTHSDSKFLNTSPSCVTRLRPL